MELVAVLLHVIIFTNPSIFQADDYSQIRSFMLNVLLLACIWSDIHFGKRLHKHAQEVERDAKASVVTNADAKPAVDEKDEKTDQHKSSKHHKKDPE